MLQAITAIVVVASVTALACFVAGFVFLEWNDYQFRHGSYCKSEPSDPLCQ